MSKPVRITFVRHGESVSNQAQRWQGQGDSPLSPLGRTQAEALGKRIGTRHFDRVIASDLMRASDTARATGFRFEQDPAFREFDVGCWEGLTKEEVEERYPDEIARLKAGEDVPLGGGESFRVFSARVDEALRKVRASVSPGEHVLIVCHGGVIGTALSGFLGLRGSRRFPLARVSNTSISEVLIGGEREDDVVLRVFNDGRHVSAVAPWPAFEVKAGCVALFCAASRLAETELGLPEGYGSFGAHYDTRHSLLEVAPEAPGEAPAGRLRQVMKTLLDRHPEQRVSVAAPAATIRTWAASALWSAEQSNVQLELPSAGNLCHLGTWGDSLVLHDYGVSLD